jgi:hypothetical protein
MTDPHSASLMKKLEPGVLVFTRDGEELGRIKELTETHMKIDARLKRDYWLSASDLIGLDSGVARVDFVAKDLELHQFETPEPTAHSPSPMLDAMTDTFDSEEERTRRRHEMEHPPGSDRN